MKGDDHRNPQPIQQGQHKLAVEPAPQIELMLQIDDISPTMVDKAGQLPQTGKVVAMMDGHDLAWVGMYSARIFERNYERIDGQALARVGREGVEQVRRVDPNAAGIWGIAGQGEQAQRL